MVLKIGGYMSISKVKGAFIGPALKIPKRANSKVREALRALGSTGLEVCNARKTDNGQSVLALAFKDGGLASVRKETPSKVPFLDSSFYFGKSPLAALKDLLKRVSGQEVAHHSDILAQKGTVKVPVLDLTA